VASCSCDEKAFRPNPLQLNNFNYDKDEIGEEKGWGMILLWERAKNDYYDQGVGHRLRKS